MYPGFVLSFKVHEAGCRFYAVLCTFLFLAVVSAFIWAYVHYPTTRAELLTGILKHYVPMAALVLLAAFGLAYFIRRLDS